MKRYLLEPAGEGEPLGLVLRETDTPNPGPGEVQVKMRACSLNYRDLLVRSGQSASGGDGGIVPLSDGAGEVVALGEGVTGLELGDRVALTFFRDWEESPFEMRYHKAARGGSCDGVLSEMVTVPAESVIRFPDHLSFAEAACLPCAGLTAWQALFERGRPLSEGGTLLCLGTGGVSIFALQFAAAVGGEVIVTSSSDGKLERALSLGARHGINYRTHPDWDREVFSLTEKRGVDQVIEVGGPGTLEKSLNSVGAGGTISLIGVLTGFDPSPASLFPLVARAVDLNGIYVGSREMFARMNLFIAEHGIRPVIDDHKFGFGEVEEAYDFLESGKHFGKVVIDFSVA